MMMKIKACNKLLVLIIVVSSGFINLEEVNCLGAKDVVFVVLSQENGYHLEMAQESRNNIFRQADELGLSLPSVHLSHADFPHIGGWTIVPLIPGLVKRHRGNCSVVFFMGEQTRVRLKELLEVLDGHAGKEAFLGFALHDQEPSIIHHFAFYADPTMFKYPNIASGFAITTPLLLSLNKRLSSSPPKTDFNIDVSHELSLFIWDEGNGTELTHEPRFCVEQPEKDVCVTYPQPFEPCDTPVANEDIYFAVKTCQKFHRDRIPVVQGTWGRTAKRIVFYSDVEDAGIPTRSLGVENTEQGHCEKTFSIIREVRGVLKGEKWVVIADDDTILSVSGLQDLLSCYDPSEPLILGERYGYGARAPKGYNYITGGGGVVISRPLLEILADSCDCPSATTPDDMYLGFCLRELGIDVTHSPLFHQARPDDYAEGYLRSHKAVSFHKHWMIDPVKVYKTWFADMDASDVESDVHTEL